MYHVLCQNYCHSTADNICSFLKLRVDFTVARNLRENLAVFIECWNRVCVVIYIYIYIYIDIKCSRIAFKQNTLHLRALE